MSRPYRKKLNHRLVTWVKCYTAEDLAELFDVGTPAVLGWISKDLKTIDNQKQYMMFGVDIISWIKKHQPTKKKIPDPNKVYCLKCHSLINRFGEVYIHTFKQTQKGLSGSTPAPLKQTFIKEKNNAPIQPKERAGQIPLF